MSSTNPFQQAMNMRRLRARSDVSIGGSVSVAGFSLEVVDGCVEVPAQYAKELLHHGFEDVTDKPTAAQEAAAGKRR